MTMVEERAVERGLDACDVRFTRRELREYTSWGQTQILVHLERLESHEYVTSHRSGYGSQQLYELLGTPRTEDARTTSGYRGSSAPNRGVIGGGADDVMRSRIEPKRSALVNGAANQNGAHAKNALKGESPKITS
jgi:hypothetical protein